MTMDIDQGIADRFASNAYPEDVSTGGLGPCTGVIVFDPKSKVTYGAHLTSPTVHDRSTLESMLQRAANEFSGSTNVCVYLSGCCCDPYVPDHHPDTVRPIVECIVRNILPNAKFDIRWPGPNVRCVSMTLDPSTGACDIECN